MLWRGSLALGAAPRGEAGELRNLQQRSIRTIFVNQRNFLPRCTDRHRSTGVSFAPAAVRLNPGGDARGGKYAPNDSMKRHPRTQR